MDCIREVERLLQGKLEDLSLSLGIRDGGVLNLRYSTLALSPLKVKRKGKTYSYVQLKGITYWGSKTVKSWREGEVPREVEALIEVYRALKALERVRNYVG